MAQGCRLFPIHEVSSLRKPKSSNILSQRKNFVKSVRKQYANSDSHPFFLQLQRFLNEEAKQNVPHSVAQS